MNNKLRTFSKERIDAAGVILMQSIEKVLNNKHLFTDDQFNTFLVKVNAARMAMRSSDQLSDDTIAAYCQDVIDYVDTLYS